MKAKNHVRRLTTLVLLAFASSAVQAQCNHDPTITNPNLGTLFEGVIVFCGVDDTQVLSTGVYEGYQWYKQLFDFFGTGENVWEVIPGATSQTLTVDGYNDFGYSFKVAATLNGCTEESPVVFMDAFAYSLPAMEAVFVPDSAQMIFNEEGIPSHWEVCMGNPVVFKDMTGSVYGEHTWYNCMPGAVPPDATDPCIIPGATGDEITTTTSGVYGFYACTEYCPNLCEFLGGASFMDIRFGDYGFCGALDIPEPIREGSLSLYPNPTENYLFIGDPNETYKEVFIIDMAGKTVLRKENHLYNVPIDITQLLAGTYSVLTKTVEGKLYKNKLVKS